MKSKTIYSLIPILCILFGYSQIKTKSTEDEKRIIALYLSQYFNNYKFISKTYVCQKSKFILDQRFLKRINDKASRYERSKNACDKFLSEGKDTLGLSACSLSKMYSKYIDILTRDEKLYFLKYTKENGFKDYTKLISDNRIKLINHNEFVDDDFEKNLDTEKLEIRGPFFSMDKSKALLEVYKKTKSIDDGFILYIIFTKQKNNWKMVGNVNF